MSRILAISDIHGHVHALHRLLTYAKYQADQDELYFVGDYIDKGPSSEGTLKAVEYYVRNGAYAIMGNHEKCALDDIAEGSKKWIEWKSFLQSLPLYIERKPFLFVHAGIRTGIPLHAQQINDLLTIRDPFLQAPLQEDTTVVFGHTPTNRLGVPAGSVWQQPKKLGIDTGAGQQQYLSLIDLTNSIQYRISVTNPLLTEVDVLMFSSAINGHTQ
ncbi:metallophosphoesterase [Psychrobacillus sp. NPDC096426]|uniref:metallophosphoesterase n=1 Tax=Psychrobacillus sp. NPDC096426 TaxID=3364491 RepID=UPI00381F7470